MTCPGHYKPAFIFETLYCVTEAFFICTGLQTDSTGALIIIMRKLLKTIFFSSLNFEITFNTVELQFGTLNFMLERNICNLPHLSILILIKREKNFHQSY